MTYSEKLKDPRWQRKRLEVFQRDGYACRICDAKDKTLHVHHCFYEKGNPWNTGMEFLLTLCHECHEDTTEIENAAKRALGKIFATIRSANLQDLRCSIEQCADGNGEDFPIMVKSHEYDHQSDIRWFHRAVQHKAMRKHYEAVTGQKVKWSNLNHENGLA